MAEESRNLNLRHREIFEEVAEQTKWDDKERNLHLKLALQGTAIDCVQGDTAEQIAQSLLTR